MGKKIRWILISVLVFSLSTQFLISEKDGSKTVDLMISGGTIITMDGERRVIKDGALAITGDRIVEVGNARELQSKYQPKRTIDAKNVREESEDVGDLSGWEGTPRHQLVKTMGMGRPQAWWKACELIYAEGSDEDFWHADALLAALERLKLAEKAIEDAINRTNLQHLLTLPERFWGVTKGLSQ